MKTIGFFFLNLYTDKYFIFCTTDLISKIYYAFSIDIFYVVIQISYIMRHKVILYLLMYC